MRGVPPQDLLVVRESGDYFEGYLVVVAASHCDCDHVASVGGHFVHCEEHLVWFDDYCSACLRFGEFVLLERRG